MTPSLNTYFSVHADLGGLFAKHVSGAWREVRPGLRAEFSTVPAPALNTVAIDGDYALDDLMELVQRMQAEGLPASLETRTETDELAQPAIHALSLVKPEKSTPFMVLNALAGVDDAGVHGVTIRRVVVDEFDHYADGLADGYEMPLDIARTIARAVLPEENIFNVIGERDGEVVATAAAYVRDEICGIYNISTVPSARRQGIGDAVTRAALVMARDVGATSAYLQASPMGFPVYEKLGFTVESQYTFYALPVTKAQNS